MAPVISKLSRAEEEAVLSALLTQRPTLQVDMLSASAAVKEGENFMSVVTKIDVTGHDLTNGDIVSETLIMKSLPQSAERCATFHCDAASINEANFYSKVLTPLTALTKLSFPGCLLATEDLLLLRHLGKDGFIMADRRKGLDLSHCQLVLQELGRFHAASLALKHQNPDEIVGISALVNEIFINKDNVIFNPCVDSCIDMALKAAADLNSPVVHLLRTFYGRGFHVISPHIAPSEPLAVVCHGDLWSNNMLFHYSKENPETPDRVCFLDQQGWRYPSPSLDILYFLFTSGRVGMVRQHFDDLISTYHQSLMNELEKLAPSAPEVTLNDIKEEIRRHAVYGLIMSLMSLPVVTAEDIVFKLDEVTEEVMQSQEYADEIARGFLNQRFVRKVNEIFQIFCEEGFL
ncbi:hypothetical protein J6590_058586 [Homalodisca vitripennis]|nr:hypothetical protein J6590_058586 [Homalodisca vitripennis]